MEGGYARGVRRQAGAPGARDGRAARPPPVDRDVVRARRAARRRRARRARSRNATRADVGQGGARPVDRARDRARTTAPGRSCAARARATTRTCGSAGGTARSAGLAPAVRAVPRLGRFVSAFGAQSVPETAGVDAPRAVAAPRLGRRSPSTTGWSAARVRRARARRRREVVRRVARRDAGVPGRARCSCRSRTSGAARARRAAASRCSASPTRRRRSGFGLLDHERVPKRAYAAVRDACRPVLAMVDPRTGNVHVVNDTRRAIVGRRGRGRGRRPDPALARRHRRRRGGVRRHRRPRRRGRRRGRARRIPTSAASRTATRSSSSKPAGR